MAKHDGLIDNGSKTKNNNNGLRFPANKKKPKKDTEIPPSLSGIAATETMGTDLTNINNKLIRYIIQIIVVVLTSKHFLEETKILIRVSSTKTKRRRLQQMLQRRLPFIITTNKR